MPAGESTLAAAAPSRTRSIAFVGLSIAIMAVSAWVTIPLGPIPFTLQMFAVPFAIVLLTPGQAMASIIGYLVLGAIGVPVFSGMRGGIGVLAGPTGGFLWGYLFGVAAGALLLYVVRFRTDWDDTRRQLRSADPALAASLKPVQKVLYFLRSAGIELLAGVLFTAIAYLCGWAQYMVVAGVGPLASFLACCAPFILLDLAKIAAAVVCARAVRSVVAR